MKTESVLDKYTKILAGILNIPTTDIVIERKISALAPYEKVGEIIYQKENEPDTLRDFSQGEYRIRLLNQPFNAGHVNRAGKIASTITIVSTFKLYEMPHCCAFLISCNAHVMPEFRNKRIGTILNNLRQDIGRLLGYSALLCTDINSNTHQRQLLATNGWKDIFSITNKRTNNLVHISVITL